MSADLAAFVDDSLIERTDADHARLLVYHLAPERTAADTRRLRRAVLAAVGHLSVECAADASDPRSKIGVDVHHITQKRTAVDYAAVLVYHRFVEAAMTDHAVKTYFCGDPLVCHPRQEIRAA